MSGPGLRVAAFVSGHGWGHAARATAVLAALRERVPDVQMDLFTTVPRWFLEEALGPEFRLHRIQGDVGLVQHDALREDLGATVAALDRFAADLPDRATEAAAILGDVGADVVMADIAPLGIVAGRRARVPVALVENFTWDWIYEGYLDDAPDLAPHARYLGDLYGRATLRIQTAPVCAVVSGAMSTEPVARRLRRPGLVREALDIPAGRPLVVVSMGGVGQELRFTRRLAELSGVEFVLLSDEEADVANVRALPADRRPYHPDLLAAADAVVGKLGYSTVAEALHGGTRYVHVERPAFRESAILAAYLARRLPTLPVDAGSFQRGDWVAELPGLLQRPVRPRPATGADTVAEALVSLARGESPLADG